MRSRISCQRLLRPGATLLELLGAAAIFGLFVTLAAPEVVTTSGPVDTGAQTVLTGLLQAQRMAVTEGRNVIVTFELPDRRLAIHLDTDHDGERGPGEEVRLVDLGGPVEFGAGPARPRPDDEGPVSFAADADGRPRVVFRRNGSVSEPGALYLTAPGAEPGDVRLITVSRASGRGTAHELVDGEWAPLGRPR